MTYVQDGLTILIWPWGYSEVWEHGTKLASGDSRFVREEYPHAYPHYIQPLPDFQERLANFNAYWD